MDQKQRREIAASLLNLASELLGKKLWVQDVKTKWHPPEGFFKQSATKIAKGLKENSKDLKQAMSRLNFYINRGGKNLTADDRERLNLAKRKLEKLYGG